MTEVQFFATCLVDSMFPRIGEAVVSTLRRVGCSVSMPRRQTCCGQPLFNAGMHREAMPIAQQTLRLLEPAAGAIVVPSGSCAHMLRHGYLELFAENPSWLERAKGVAERVFEFTEYLVDHLGLADVGARWDGVVAYHPSCHTLRNMRIDRQPRLLLGNVRGAQIVPLPEEEDCCGFGGIFSVEHPELSTELLKRKVDNLAACAAPSLVLAEPGCLMHIAGGLHRRGGSQRVLHIAELLNQTGERGN